VDFGVSLLMEENDDTLKSTAGTKLYSAPELFDKDEIKGKQTDIWAAGVTLFYMSTGKLPFLAETLHQLMDKILHEE
jgi:serine/threonine protein kinase